MQKAPQAFGSDAYLQFALGNLTPEQAVRVAYYEKAHSGLNIPSAEERENLEGLPGGDEKDEEPNATLRNIAGEYERAEAES